MYLSCDVTSHDQLIDGWVLQIFGREFLEICYDHDKSRHSMYSESVDVFFEFVW